MNAIALWVLLILNPNGQLTTMAFLTQSDCLLMRDNIAQMRNVTANDRTLKCVKSRMVMPPQAH
jgi:hypothetical protein